MTESSDRGSRANDMKALQYVASRIPEILRTNPLQQEDVNTIKRSTTEMYRKAAFFGIAGGLASAFVGPRMLFKVPRLQPLFFAVGSTVSAAPFLSRASQSCLVNIMTLDTPLGQETRRLFRESSPDSPIIQRIEREIENMRRENPPSFQHDGFTDDFGAKDPSTALNNTADRGYFSRPVAQDEDKDEYPTPSDPMMMMPVMMSRSGNSASKDQKVFYDGDQIIPMNGSHERERREEYPERVAGSLSYAAGGARAGAGTGTGTGGMTRRRDGSGMKDAQGNGNTWENDDDPWGRQRSRRNWSSGGSMSSTFQRDDTSQHDADDARFPGRAMRTENVPWNNGPASRADNRREPTDELDRVDGDGRGQRRRHSTDDQEGRTDSAAAGKLEESGSSRSGMSQEMRRKDDHDGYAGEEVPGRQPARTWADIRRERSGR